MPARSGPFVETTGMTKPTRVVVGFEGTLVKLPSIGRSESHSSNSHMSIP